MEFLTAENGYFETDIKHSRFIGQLFKADSEEEAKLRLLSVKKEHSLATHNCYAYIVYEDGAERTKYSDDREPSGTAGMPILNVIKGRGLCNVLVVVTRYFGGIKLGTGGLCRAYTDSAIGACDNAESYKCALCERIKVCLSYENYKNFSLVKLPKDAFIENTEYGENVEITVCVKQVDAESFIKDYQAIFYKNPSISRLNTLLCKL